MNEFCSPLELSPATNFPIIIKSNLVFLDFKTANQTKDAFSGAFSFQNGELEFILEYYL